MLVNKLHIIRYPFFKWTVHPDRRQWRTWVIPFHASNLVSQLLLLLIRKLNLRKGMLLIIIPWGVMVIKMGPRLANIRCYNCKSWGHYATSCTKRQNDKRCYNCGQYEHLRRTCLKPINTNSQQQRESNFQQRPRTQFKNSLKCFIDWGDSTSL